MRVEITIEGRKAGSNQLALYRDAFEIDDESRAQERLTAAIAAIQRDFVRKPDKSDKKDLKKDDGQRSLPLGTPGGAK